MEIIVYIDKCQRIVQVYDANKSSRILYNCMWQVDFIGVPDFEKLAIALTNKMRELYDVQGVTIIDNKKD